MKVQGNEKIVEPRKPVVSLGGLRGDLSRILEPIKQNLEILTGRRAGVKELKGLPSETPRKQIISKINELVARLNGSGTVLPEQAQPGDKTDGEYAPLDHTHVKADITDFPNLAMVAYSGSYEDLHDTPTIPDPVTVDSALSSTSTNPVQNKVINTALAGKAAASHTHVAGDVSGLATVATSGSYNDLSNKPTIPVVPTNVSAFTNDAGYLTQHQDISGKANTADLATVAFSGSYNDLSNKPTIPTVPTNVSAFTNDAGYLTQHQDLSDYVQATDLSAVATSGSYNDLTDTPTIPTVPTNVSAFTNDAGYATTWYIQQYYLPRLGGSMGNGAIIYWGSNSSLRVSGNTTQGMYVGCGTAGTGAGAELALYNQDVGAAGKEGNFELTASTVESSQSGGTVVASVLRGTPDGALTWGGTSISLDGHTHSYNDLTGKPSLDFLPLAGGEITGRTAISLPTTAQADTAGEQPSINLSSQTITTGTNPSAPEYWGIYFTDSSKLTNYDGRIAAVECAVRDTGQVSLNLGAYQFVSGKSAWTGSIISATILADGTRYVTLPTPAAGDNSTKAATTAWVTTAMTTTLGSYLPLAGGTMTGVINRNGTLAQSNSTTGSISIQNGTAASGGGGIWMYGASHSSNPGVVRLQSYNSSTSKYYALDVKNDASLTWSGDAFGFTTVAGTIKVASGASRLGFHTGDNNFDGSSLQMFGRSHSSYAGRFYLRASTKTSSSDTTGTSYDLTGYPNGSLTWSGSSFKVGGTEVSLDGHTHSYLPLAGGTMTGDITRNGILAKSGAASGSVCILGGVSAASTAGGKVYAYGVSHSSNPGQVMLQAGDADGYRQFILKPDGAIKWDGRDRFFGLGTYSSVHLKGAGILTSSGTALDLFLPIPFGKGVTTITMTSITGALRYGSGGYLTPGNSSSSNILSGSTVSWYNLDSNCPTIRLVRSGGWGSGVPNNSVIGFDITVAFKCT
jgi:hypothetical protein